MSKAKNSKVAHEQLVAVICTGGEGTDQYAIVQFPQKDKLSVILTSTSGKNDRVRYVELIDEADIEKGVKPVFGEDLYAFVEDHDEMLERTFHQSLDKNLVGSQQYKVRAEAALKLVQEQRKSNRRQTQAVGCKKYSSHQLRRLGDLDYLTGRVSIVFNYKSSEYNAVFETKQSISDMISAETLPPGVDTAYLYVEDSEAETGKHKTVYEDNYYFSMPYSSILMQSFKHAKQNSSAKKTDLHPFKFVEKKLKSLNGAQP